MKRRPVPKGRISMWLTEEEAEPILRARKEQAQWNAGQRHIREREKIPGCQYRLWPGYQCPHKAREGMEGYCGTHYNVVVLHKKLGRPPGKAPKE